MKVGKKYLLKSKNELSIVVVFLLCTERKVLQKPYYYLQTVSVFSGKNTYLFAPKILAKKPSDYDYRSTKRN